MMEGPKKSGRAVHLLPYGAPKPLQREEWVRWGGIGLSAACYAAALLLPSYFDIFTGVSGKRYTGWQCLMAPIMVSPWVLLVHLYWFANPLYLLALWALLSRVWAVAMGVGFVALLIALAFLAAERPGNRPPEPGYWLWLAAMALVTVSGCILSLYAPLDRKGKVRHFRLFSEKQR